MIRGLGVALVALALAGCGGPQIRAGGHTERAAMSEARQRADAYAAFTRGALLAQQEAWDAAAAALDDACHADPEAWRPRLLLADVLRQGAPEGDAGERQRARALSEARLAAELGAPAAEVAIVEAHTHVASGSYARATEALRSVALRDTSRAFFGAWYRIVNESDDSALLVEATSRYIEAQPASRSAWRYHGFALREHGQLREAASAFEHATTLANPDPDDAEEQIATLILLEDWPAALGASVACRARFRDYIPCYAQEAALHARARDPSALRPPGALTEVELVDIDPATQAALDRLSARSAGNRRDLWRARQVLENAGDPGLVVGFAYELARQRPFNVSVLTTAAWMCARAGAMDDAVVLMERVLAQDESSFDALNFIGYTWADANMRLDDAERYIRRAVFLRPDAGGILDSLAWVLYRRGALEEALEVQLEAMALEGDNAILWDHLGDIYRALGRSDDAIDAYERALQLATPYDEDVLETVPAKLEELRDAP